MMVDAARTALARLMVRHLRRPPLLLIQSWLWLAANASDTEEKRRCLNAVRRLDPENEPASLALLVLDQARPTS